MSRKTGQNPVERRGFLLYSGYMLAAVAFLKRKLPGPFSVAEWLYIGAWCIFMMIVWSNMFVYDGATYWAGWGHLWADWSAHISYTLNMANRSLILPYHPLYWGIPFRYHFAADLFSAVLLRTGMPIVQAFILPSILGSFALILSVYFFYRVIFKNTTVAMISTPLFIFNGGLGFLCYVYYVVTNNPILHQSDHIFTLSQIDNLHIEFANIMTNYFIPQRAFLLGFPISIFIITYLWQLLDSNTIIHKKWQIAGLALLTGIFPIIHLYSYVVIVCIAGFLAIWNQMVYRKGTVYWYIYLVISVFIGGTVFMLFWGKSGANHFTWYPFWTASGNFIAWLIYWVMNEGLLFVFTFVGYFFLSKHQKIFSIPFAVLFIISNMVIFQPHGWDNGKFITYSYLWSAGIVGNFILRIYNKYRHSNLIPAMLAVLFCFSILSGAVDVVNLTKFNSQKIRFFTDGDLQLGRKVSALIPKDDLLLTGPITSYVSILSGRQVFMGLDFWVSSYGIDTVQRNKVIQEIYAGGPDAETLIRKYRINFILISPREREILKINDNFFDSLFTPALRTEDTVIYKVQYE